MGAFEYCVGQQDAIKSNRLRTTAVYHGMCPKIHNITLVTLIKHGNSFSFLYFTIILRLCIDIKKT